MRVIQRATTFLVSVYRKLPYKPFQEPLREWYQNFLKSSRGNRTVVKKVKGISYELDLTEVIDSAIFYSDSREPATTKALNVLCKPGYVVVDIGANVGSHALPIAQAVGESGVVYAFEPVPWALDKLKKNISLNSFNNIIVEPVALSDVIEEGAEFSLRASFKSTSSTPVNDDGELNDNWWDACEKVKVKVQTLDDFVRVNNIKHINVIKLDVDGFEVKVLNGGVNIIKCSKPAIVMELAPSWLSSKGDSVESLIEFLLSMGYVFFNEETFKKIPNILEQVNLLAAGAGINVVCQHRTKI